MNKIEFLSKIEDDINTILSTINALKTTEHFGVIERDIILESIRNLYSFCITTDVDNSNKIQSVHSVISQIEDAIDQELIDAVNKAEQQEFIETETSQNIDDIDQEMIKAVEMAEQLQNSTETENEEQFTDEEPLSDNEEMSMPSFGNPEEDLNDTVTDDFEETIVDNTEESVVEPADEPVVELPETPVIDNVSAPKIKKEEKPRSVTDQYQQTNTLNDIISNISSKTDIQSIITKQPIEDLNKAFGVNDKFRFSKLLFNNNIQDFNNTIWEINLLNNLDEAIMYISEKYSWSADDETVQEFIIMLQRRFN
jgi:hypothetical protein